MITNFSQNGVRTYRLSDHDYERKTSWTAVDMNMKELLLFLPTRPKTWEQYHLAIALMFLGPTTTTTLNSGAVVLRPRPRPPPPLPRLFRAIALVKRWALDRAFGCRLIFFARLQLVHCTAGFQWHRFKIVTLLYLFDHAGHNQIRWWILREMVSLCVCVRVFVLALVAIYATVVVPCSGRNSLIRCFSLLLWL